MPTLLSLESLPYSCSEVLKYLHSYFGHQGHIAFVTAGPVGFTPAPRPAPAPGDPYHELHAVLQRIIGVRLAVQRNPAARTVCVLDGWIPPMAFPHPVLHELCVEMEAATLRRCGIGGHVMLYFRGCPHESFERVLENGSDPENSGPLMSLADVLGARNRLDRVAKGDISASPFPLLGCHVIALPSFCEDNVVASSQIARTALTYLLHPQKWITGS